MNAIKSIKNFANNYGFLVEDIKKNIKLLEKEINLLLSLVDEKKIKKKEFILQSGNICRYSYFLKKGCLKKYYINEEGKERIFEFATENQWIGDQDSFWRMSTSIFNIIALEKSEIIQISKSNMELLLEKLPKFERYFRIVGNNSLGKYQRRVKQSLSCSAEERYSDFRNDYPGLELRISQKDIASYLGVSPEFLSTLRRKV